MQRLTLNHGEAANQSYHNLRCKLATARPLVVEDDERLRQELLVCALVSRETHTHEEARKW